MTNQYRSNLNAAIIVSGSNGSFSANALTFGNGGNVSFYTNNSNQVLASAAGGAGGGIDVSVGGNTSGTLALISSGTAVFAGGNNITLSQVGNNITISGANAGGAQTGISGIQVSNTTYSAGTVVFNNANGISFGSSGANGVSASYTVPSTAGLISAVKLSAGTVSNNLTAVTFSNSNNVSFGMNGSTITASASFAQSAQTGISGFQVSNTTYTSGTVSLVNANGISFGSSGANGISASYTVPTQTVQTQASGNIGGTGFATTTTNGVVIVGTNNTGGITLAVPPYLTTQSVQTQAAGNIAGTGTTFAGTNISASMTFNSNGLNLALSGNTGGAGGGIDVSVGGNTSGTLALISSGTLSLAGGNNITLSQVGNNITISGANAGGAQTGISGVIVSNTTYSSGTISYVNANGISFGSSGANGISASYTVPIQTTQPVAISGSNGSFVFSTLTMGNLNGLSHYTSNGSIVASYTVPTQSAQTVGLYMVSQTTGGSSSSTVDARSISYAGYGMISVGLSGGTVQISGPATTAFSGLSAGISTLGNTSGNTGIASNQLILVGGNNITLSGSTNAGSMTITVSAANAGGAQTGISGVIVSNTTYTSGTISYVNANGISFGSSGANGISASYTVPSTAGLISRINVSAGTTSNNVSAITFSNSNGFSFGLNGSVITGSYNSTQFAGTGTTFAGNNVSVSMTLNSNGLNISASVPAISTLIGVSGISISSNGGSIYIFTH